MPASSHHEPLAGFNFRVEIDGIVVAVFSKCRGLSSETEVVEYREGGDQRIRKLPGITKFSNITLKRGITQDRTLWEWRQTVVNGRVERRNGSVILLDTAHSEVARWNFFDAWPAKWEGPDLDARSSDVCIETLELAPRGLRVG
jgi:phage tail-like protein